MNREKFAMTISKLRNGEIETNLSLRHRKMLPKYVYHYTNIDNAASILERGEILSRNKLRDSGSMINDNASDEVIEQTSSRWKDYVRFYFRPRTPTQYNNEGIRCRSTMSSFNSHCPIPIFFLFNSVAILNTEGVYFTNGSLANRAEHILYNTPEEFEKLPFSMIFHNRAILPNEDTAEIKRIRHTEVIKRDVMRLDSLEFIVVRSHAEKQTLLSYLSPEVKQAYEAKIKIDSNNDLFFGYWTYIENVILDHDSIQIAFNVGQTHPTFDIELYITPVKEGLAQQWISNDREISEAKLSLDFLESIDSYFIEVFLDGILTYSGEYKGEENLPF